MPRRAWWRRRSALVAAAVVIVVVVIVAFATGALGLERHVVSHRDGHATEPSTRCSPGSRRSSPCRRRRSGFPTSGTVESISVQVGDEVAAGADLAQLDTESLEADLHSAQAELAQAQLTLEHGLNGEKSGSSPTGGSGGTGDSGTFSSTSSDGARIVLTATSTDPELAAAQRAVLQAQQHVDAALAIASTAYENAVAVRSADPPDTTACEDALDAALDAQKDVQTAQHQLVDASVAYDELLSERAARARRHLEPVGRIRPDRGQCSGLVRLSVERGLVARRATAARPRRHRRPPTWCRTRRRSTPRPRR